METMERLMKVYRYTIVPLMRKVSISSYWFRRNKGTVIEYFYSIKEISANQYSTFLMYWMLKKERMK